MTLRSSFYFLVFSLINSAVLGKLIGFVNSIYTFLLAEMLPKRTSGGLGPLLELFEAAASLASYFCFKMVAKKSPMSAPLSL